jgi:hypothetical protein
MGSLRGVGMEKCVHLIPRAKLLVVLPATRDRLLLHPLDLQAELAKKGIDYLLMTSLPPDQVRRGKTLEYAMQACCLVGAMTFRLESGPDGMTVTPDGKLTWAVPADFANKDVSVIVSVKSAGGKEIFHNFRVAVVAP